MRHPDQGERGRAVRTQRHPEPYGSGDQPRFAGSDVHGRQLGDIERRETGGAQDVPDQPEHLVGADPGGGPDTHDERAGRDVAGWGWGWGWGWG